ncbi:MAG TPA: DUF3450 family protein [Methylomirabilota bacterium]|nr:DUF3450 family protein [Methylomirabilota bacterium]
MNRTLIVAASCLLTWAWAGHAQSDKKLSDARTALEKWVETRQLISKTRADWQADKETIQQTIVMLERELKGVEEQFTRLSTNNVQADKERLEAEALLKSSDDGIAPAQQFASEFEGQIRAVLPRLPDPLKDSLKPLLARLPAEGATNTQMKATERVQVLLGLLNEMDKFNNAVNVFSEKQKNDQGGEVSVETVYVGLGAAYFVNDAGDFAGTGSPGATGWEWINQPKLANHVREVIRIYRNERPAKFVSLPAVIK